MIIIGSDIAAIALNAGRFTVRADSPSSANSSSTVQK
jgi:hypothetical protein